MENNQNNERDFLDKHAKTACCLGFLASAAIMIVLGYFLFTLIKALIA